MPTVLALSSQVVYGSVGNSAAVPALQRLGVAVLALPTVILSHHPGLGPPVRQQIPPEVLKETLEGLASQGRLNDVAAVMTGYFGEPAQVDAVAAAISRMKQAGPSLVYLCDPIVGDDPDGLYIPQAVADAIRSRLIPLADAITPNRFELAWLAQREVRDPRTAAEAARNVAPLTLATSIPLQDDKIGTMLIGGDAAFIGETRRRAAVPHGTGDLLAGLFLGHLVLGHSGSAALGRALGGLEAVLDVSEGRDALDLAGGLPGACAAKPWLLRQAIR